MKQGLSTLILLCCLAFVSAEIRPASARPRLSSFYLDHIYPADNASMIPLLARYQLVVLDMEIGDFNPNLLSGIKAANPQIKLCAYIHVSEMTTHNPSPPYYSLRAQLKGGIQDSWYLRTSTGAYASVWPNTRMLNCSPYCPVVNGQTWNSYLQSFITQTVLGNPLWDGVFLDGCYSGLPWNEAPDLDLNSDGIADDFSWRDLQWQAGMNPFLQNLRTNNPGKICIGNAAYTYGAHLNGAMMEEWQSPTPEFNFGLTWVEFMARYQSLDADFQSPTYNMIQARQPYNNQYNYKHMRYTLSTAMLGDAYYAIDYGPDDHSDTWWYDEYNVNLGEPLGLNEYLEANQIANGDFGSGLNYWETELHYPNTATLSLINSSGNNYAQVNITNLEAGLPENLDYKIMLKHVNDPNFSFIHQSYYKITFRAKSSSPRLIRAMVQRCSGDYAWLMDNALSCQLGTDWQSYEYYVRANNPFNYQGSDIRLCFNLAQAASTVCLDDVKVQRLPNGFLRSREYEHGLVICNPGNSSVSIPLSDTYYRIQGTQDPTVNNGLSCTQITVAAQDGIILLKSRPQISLLSSPSLSYPNMWVGQCSAPQSFVIKNTGTAPLTVSGLGYAGTEGNFSCAGLSFPQVLGVNQSLDIPMVYCPHIDGNHSETLYVLNNSINNSSLVIQLSGSANYPEPLPPQNVLVTTTGNDVLITWDPVTDSVQGIPITPDSYLVLYNGSEDPDDDYYFHGLSYGCQYTHYHVVTHAPHMFYRVLAYKDSSRLTALKPEEMRFNTPESELRKLLAMPMR